MAAPETSVDAQQKKVPRAARAASTLRRKGVGITALRALNKVGIYALLPLVRRRRGRARFRVGDREHAYFVHPYNATWRSEREVEIPVAREFLGRHAPERTLEVGNVMAYYDDVRHTVLDKYEDAPGIVRDDAETFRPETDFDAIVAISTLEHVGWDEDPRDPPKLRRAIDNLRSLLAPDGRMLFTVPLGQNLFLDGLLEAGELPLEQLNVLVRRSDGEWHDTTMAEGLEVGRGGDRSTALQRRADAIAIGVLPPLDAG